MEATLQLGEKLSDDRVGDVSADTQAGLDRAAARARQLALKRWTLWGSSATHLAGKRGQLQGRVPSGEQLVPLAYISQFETRTLRTE